MRIICSLLIIIALATFGGACKSGGSGAATFCDTVCLKDSIKYVNDNHPLKPFLLIKAKDCNADSIIWSYDGAKSNRKIGFSYLFGDGIKLNKEFTRAVVSDTSVTYLLFNDCATGRGYQAKLLFDNKKGMTATGNALNNFDKKFAVADELSVYTDKGNLFVEEMTTGKTAMMTFGAPIEVDFWHVHDAIDSINVTATSIYAKVKVKGEWKELDKKITLK